MSRTTESDCGNTRLMIVLSSYTNANRCQWDVATSKCGWNRDAMNNVCLHPPTGHTTLPDSTRNCAAILKGKCPPAWEVRWLSYVVKYLLLGAYWVLLGGAQQVRSVAGVHTRLCLLQCTLHVPGSISCCQHPGVVV